MIFLYPNRLAEKICKAIIIAGIFFVPVPEDATAQQNPGFPVYLRKQAGPSASRMAAKPLPGNSDDFYHINGAWNLEMRSIYKYNSAGQQVSAVTRSVHTGQYQDKDSTGYDAQGKVVLHGTYSWANNSWRLIGGSKEIKTYNSSNLLTEIIGLSVKQGVWTNASRITTSYNTGNAVSEETSYYWSNNSWEPHERRNYVYGAAGGEPIQIIFQHYNSGGWENTERFNNILWHNFSERQFAAYHTESWIGNSWFLMSKSNTAYDALGGYESINQLWQPAGSSWVNNERTTVSYDSQLNFTSYKVETWQGNAWALDSENQEILTYNAAGELTERVRVYWDKPTRSYKYYMRQVYSNFTRISGTEEERQPLRVNLFPNPASDLLHVQLEDGLATKIQLFDLTNRLVLQEELQPGTSRVNLAQVARGAYMVRLQHAKGTYTSRLIKQ